MQKKLFFLVALMLTMTLSVVAQVTTSSMTGKVSMEGSNEEIIGASVQAVHEPSGTRYTAVTNVNGRFTIQGMRTGGPYAVTVSYIGHQTKTTKGITLQLGETYSLNVSLSENANDLAEVVVNCNRVIVMKDGTIVGEMTGDKITEEHILEIIR
jgi:hypothetical protein